MLSDNPDLKPRIDEAVSRAYRKAWLEAAKDTGLDKRDFPEACAYSLEDILSRDFNR